MAFEPLNRCRTLMSARVDVSIRLRKAVLDNDLALSKRILKANPSYLRNPDFAKKSNTSLHIAAQHGSLEIVVCGHGISVVQRLSSDLVQEHLITLGHDVSDPAATGPAIWHPISTVGPSHNTDGDTPLHLAASHSRPDVVELLCSHFPTTINRANKDGATPLHLACQAHPTPSHLVSPQAAKVSSKPAEDSSTVESLLQHNADIHAVDNNGDSCLHYASTWGNLKSIQALIQAGADPVRCNRKGWTPQSYSISVQAEVYYKTLVAKWERRRAQEAVRMTERRGKGGGGLRLVKDEEKDEGQHPAEAESRARPDSTERIPSHGDTTLQKNEAWR